MLILASLLEEESAILCRHDVSVLEINGKAILGDIEDIIVSRHGVAAKIESHALVNQDLLGCDIGDNADCRSFRSRSQSGAQCGIFLSTNSGDLGRTRSLDTDRKILREVGACLSECAKRYGLTALCGGGESKRLPGKVNRIQREESTEGLTCCEGNAVSAFLSKIQGDLAVFCAFGYGRGGHIKSAFCDKQVFVCVNRDRGHIVRRISEGVIKDNPRHLVLKLETYGVLTFCLGGGRTCIVE